MFEIVHTGLEEYRETIEYLEKIFPKETKSIARKVGNKVRTIVRREFRARVKSETGNAQKSIKRGNPFEDISGEMTIRVYASSKLAPHYHLLENGHRIVTKKGVEKGYKEGYHVFEKANGEIEANFTRIVENELDKIFDKL